MHGVIPGWGGFGSPEPSISFLLFRVVMVTGGVNRSGNVLGPSTVSPITWISGSPTSVGASELEISQDERRDPLLTS